MSLQEVIDAGLIEPQPVLPLAFLIGGALDGAALATASSENQQNTKKAMRDGLIRLLERLRVRRNRVEAKAPRAKLSAKKQETRNSRSNR